MSPKRTKKVTDEEAKELMKSALAICLELLNSFGIESILTSLTLTEDGIVKEYDCVINKYCILIAKSTDPIKYEISFSINKYQISKIASITHILTLYLYDDLFVIQDNFLSQKEQSFYFGDEAYQKFEEHVHEKNGVIKCPVCERIVLKEIFIQEKGFCKICDELELPSETFH